MVEKDKEHQPVETLWAQGVLSVPSREAEGFIVEGRKP